MHLEDVNFPKLFTGIHLSPILVLEKTRPSFEKFGQANPKKLLLLRQCLNRYRDLKYVRFLEGGSVWNCLRSTFVVFFTLSYHKIRGIQSKFELYF